ncbi:glycosyltransferase family 39 protein [Patescibacteria group bacterium]|nr:glycosyltransferase family 39 protein [Patescibacteria group bacterium]
MKKNILWLVLISIFFLATRLYQITDNPPSLYWDEASIGYNAYSVITTGRDEWGKVLPIHFRAFGEFKLPVYIYSVALAEVILGVNDLAVRFPAIIYSLGTLLITYFIAKKISGKDSIGLLSAFFISISKWLFVFSRTGYEANAGVFFYLGGLYFLLLSKKSNNFLIVSILSFAITLYCYNSFRIITPITLLVIITYLIFKLKKQVLNFPKQLSVLIGILILASIPLISFYVKGEGLIRFTDVSVDTHQGLVSFTKQFIVNYTSHFTPQFLLLTGDVNSRSQQPGFGQIYLLDVVLFILGILYIKQKESWQSAIPLLVLLIAPIPASLTKESPHALRSIIAAPAIVLLVTFGVDFLSNFPMRKALIVLIVTCDLVLFGQYYYTFVNQYSLHNAGNWQYGYKEIFTKYQSEFPNYQQIVVSDYLGNPYIFALWYLKYDPRSYLATVQYNAVSDWGFSKVAEFGKFRFEPINLSLSLSGKALIFASPQDKINKYQQRGVIENPDGTQVFKVYQSD